MDNLAAYRAVPYPGQVTTRSHPDNLAAVARLLGVDAPDPRGARILELGCADGGNLVPIAARLPGSSCVGVDLSPDHVASAEAFAAAAGVGNARFVCADVAALPDLGHFDYVIVHGVWSWVPDAAREAILAACARVLTPRGVAYVSYNVWPGWSQRRVVRQMLQWAGRGEQDPSARLAAARDLAGWLAGLPPHPRMVGTAMKSILADIGELDDWYLFHEYLAVHNRPVWFHELAARARAAGLRFLGEADFRELVPIDLPAEVQDALEERATDRETYEQLLDLVRERAFRKTLLVRPEVEARYDVDSARLDALHVGARLRLPSELGAEGEPIAIASWPVGSPPRKPDEVHAFTALSAAEKRAAARIAAAWPSTVPVAELVAAAGEEAQAVRQRLLVAYLEEAVELFATPQAAGRPTDRPVASALTRAECDHRGDEFVTSRWHGPIRVDAVQRWLLRRMDGTRDRAALAAELKAAFLGRRLPIPRDLVGGDEAPAEWLDRTLQLFSDALLLEPE